jgi:hypothetical protein
MRTTGRSLFLVSVLAVGLWAATSTPVMAAGGSSAAPAPKPKPDVEKKIWTNDDFPAVAPQSQASDTAELAAAALVTESSATEPGSENASALVNPEQDPRFYILQMASLENELASVEGQEQQLRNFRDTSTGIQPGLQLYAPCEGVSTDNLIAQLDARRSEILQQMDAVSDTARRNDIAPGILRDASDLVATLETPLSPEQQQDMLKTQAHDLARELDETRGIAQDSEAQAQSQGITLAQPSANAGGNMTTNMLENLNSRAQALEGQISDVEDQARHSGIAPGLLR